MSIRLSGYGNVATSLTSKSHIEIILLVLEGFQVLFPRFTTQPGHVASPRCRSSRPERAVHLRAVVQSIALWATIPALALHGAVDQLRPHLCRADSRLVDTLFFTRKPDVPQVIGRCSANVQQHTPLPAHS